MTRTLLALIFALVACLLPTTQVHAARPMITDDARIVDPKSCQIESWAQNFRGNATEYWALPGCNPLDWFELTIGGAYRSEPNKDGDWRTLVQFKTIFKTLETNGWGWGVSLGNLNIHPYKYSNTNELYVNVPISASFADDKVLLHLNLGAAHTRDVSGLNFTWGLGTEVKVSENILIIAETFGRSAESASGQLGIRFWIVPDRVQIDTTVGTRFAGDISADRWFSVGLRLLSPPFMPW